MSYAPHKGQHVINVTEGQTKEDLHITRLPWADLSAKFAGAKAPSGAAIFIAPTHPNYPPEWLTRHYGVLCVGWPGVEAQTFPPGKSIQVRYRVWIHRGLAQAEKLKQAFDEFTRESSKAPPISAAR